MSAWRGAYDACSTVFDALGGWLALAGVGVWLVVYREIAAECVRGSHERMFARLLGHRVFEGWLGRSMGGAPPATYKAFVVILGLGWGAFGLARAISAAGALLGWW